MGKSLYKQVLTLSLTIGLSVKLLFSQDVHFSQFDAAPLYYNPALAGLMKCDNRFIGNYKGQWKTYQTIMLSYDQPIKDFSLLGGQIGIGGLINADYAGETTYGNTMIKLLPAFHKNISDVMVLSVGLDLMLNHNGVDESKIMFPGQIDPTTGESAVGTDLEKTGRVYGDVGLGINAQFKLREDIPLNTGITFNRLAGSGGGGFASTEVPTNYRRYSLNANAEYPLNSKITLLPSIIYLNQKKYHEINFGSFGKFSVGGTTPMFDALYVGAWYRVKDAVIFGIAADRKISAKWTLNFGLSYDLTVSSFRESNKWQTGKNVGKDSFEISVKLIQCKLPIIVNPQGIINDPFR